MFRKTAAQSPAKIAASVPKPAEMAAALERLQVLQAEASACFAEIRHIDHQLSGVEMLNRYLTRERRVELEGERTNQAARVSELQLEQRACRQTIDQHRPTYAAAIKTAMLPTRRRAAERVIAAAAELQTAAAILTESLTEIERAGATATKLMKPLFLDVIGAIAREIANETESKGDTDVGRAA